MRAVVSLCAVFLLVAACGQPIDGSADPANSASPAPTASPTSQLDLIVKPRPNGEWPANLEVGCPSGPTFPMSALEEQASIEGRAEVEAAIRPFLDSEEGAFWPQQDWRILHETDTELLLVNRGETDHLHFMNLQRVEDGWKWAGASGGGPCPLRIALPEDVNTVDWRLDPSADPLTPETTDVPVLLTERECVSGQEIGDRLLGPEVVLTAEAILVAFAAIPPRGDAFDCQGNPETAYVVELPEPLGDREVRSGLELGIALEDLLDQER